MDENATQLERLRGESARLDPKPKRGRPRLEGPPVYSERIELRVTPEQKATFQGLGVTAVRNWLDLFKALR